VRRCRGDDKRHSFALQLCMLRRYARFLGDDYSVVPVRIVNHIGQQLGLPPVLFVAPPAREATDLEHERRLREYLGFTTFGAEEREDLKRYLAGPAAEGARGADLLALAENHLHACKVVLPARSAFERIIGGVAKRSEEALLLRIKARLSPELCARIDTLLAVPEGDQRSTDSARVTRIRG
jgi:hypothetical protein